MDPYDITSPIYGGNRSISNELLKDLHDSHEPNIPENDRIFTDYTLSDDTYDSNSGVNSKTRSSDRSVHFNEIIEVIQPDYSLCPQPCGCCYCICEYIYYHSSVTILLSFTFFLCIIISTCYFFF
jgi:hypothetical protein